MSYYTNEFSLKATFGDKEVSGLLRAGDGMESNVRLAKAAKTAQDEINAFLNTGGYSLPLTFTEFSAAGPGTLNGIIQDISDCFTAYHLASLGDLQKKEYDKCREEGLAWLDRLRLGEVTLDLTVVDGGLGHSGIAVISRPAVFDRHMLRERDVFGGTDQ